MESMQYSFFWFHISSFPCDKTATGISTNTYLSRIHTKLSHRQLSPIQFVQIKKKFCRTMRTLVWHIVNKSIASNEPLATRAKWYWPGNQFLCNQIKKGIKNRRRTFSKLLFRTHYTCCSQPDCESSKLHFANKKKTVFLFETKDTGTHLIHKKKGGKMIFYPLNRSSQQFFFFCFYSVGLNPINRI